MKSSLKCVDVVLGMQFGDEGKGKLFIIYASQVSTILSCGVLEVQMLAIRFIIKVLSTLRI